MANPAKGPVTDDQQALVRWLHGERLSPRAISRATGRSRSWLQAFANALYQDETPWEPGPPRKSRPRS